MNYMTDEEVRDAMRSWTVSTAETLGVSISGTYGEILDRISTNNAEMGEALEDFLKAYEEWWSISRIEEKTSADRAWLIDKIIDRDEARRKLTIALSEIEQ